MSVQVKVGALPEPGSVGAHIRLGVLNEEIRSCSRCDLSTGRTHAVPPCGDHAADVMIVGEAPGASEDEQGVPFVGRAGQLLDRMITAMGLTRDRVFLAYVCCCRPPAHRTPTPEEMGACMPYLQEQIALVQPRVIVALGATATKVLLRTALGIKGLRGTWKLYRNGPVAIPVMPTYHPAYLLRETEAGRVDAKHDAWKDLQAVMKMIGAKSPAGPVVP